MRLTFDALLVIDAIERLGSFAAAAEALHRVPSAVTYTVQKLEEGLDVALFDRSGHRARLTPAGRELVDRGRHLIEAGMVLEGTVKRIATGWESELRIAVSDVLPPDLLYPLVERFYAENHGTRLRLLHEVLGGTWDALANDRADLAIGLPGDVLASDGFDFRPIGTMEFVFVVAPDHPLASHTGAITPGELRRHRAVAAADSSRNLPPYTIGLLSGQEVLTVASMAAKRLAHLAGLGVGSLPRYMVADDLAAGRLVERPLSKPLQQPEVHLGWNGRHEGNALRWFIEQVSEPSLYAGMILPMA